MNNPGGVTSSSSSIVVIWAFSRYVDVISSVSGCVWVQFEDDVCDDVRTLNSLAVAFRYEVAFLFQGLV